MSILLSLDLSTTCTGWSVFNIDTKELLSYGFIKGKVVKDSSPIRATLRKCQNMAAQIRAIVDQYKPVCIVLEEIAGSKNRLGQKTLDIMHGILWLALIDLLDIVNYYDVSGAEGWRTNLGLKLSDADKLANKEAKKLNPKLARGTQKLPIYDAKDLAARYVNRAFKLSLDPQTTQSDADVGDSIAMGAAFLIFRYPKK